MTPWINVGLPYHTFKIESVRKCYGEGVRFVGDLCLAVGDNFTDEPYAVYYQPLPDLEKGHSYYFGLKTRSDGTFICNAASVADGTWAAMKSNDGEIIFSRWRHDFRTSMDGSVSVDGGRNYMRRLGAGGEFVALKVVDGTWTIVDRD